MRTRVFALAGLLLFAVFAAFAMTPKPRSNERQALELERMVPTSFADWRVDPSVKPVIPSPDVQASLDKLYDQVLSRTYINSRGERMMLSLAYGGNQNDQLKAHRQEVCYSAQGFKITELLHDTLRFGDSMIPVTRMMAVRGERFEPVTYWFTMGDRVVLSRFERLMVQIKYGLSREIPDGMLVRVSSFNEEARPAYVAQQLFLRDLLAGMRREDTPHLLGAVGS